MFGEVDAEDEDLGWSVYFLDGLEGCAYHDCGGEEEDGGIWLKS